MNLPLFLARRLRRDEADRRKASRPAIRISIAGVAIGLAVMVVSVCVVLGFKHTIRDKVLGFGSHIIVANMQSLYSDGSYPVCMDDSMLTELRGISGVRHVQRYAMKQGILKTDSDVLGVTFKGLAQEYDTTFLASCMVEGRLPRFSDTESSNEIAISSSIADKLHLTPGTRIFTYFMGDDNVRTRRFTITGIYRTNMRRFDEGTCFTDLHTIVRLNGWEPDQASGAEMTLSDFSLLDASDFETSLLVDRREDKHGAIYASTTILQLYPSVFAWLDLLDIDVWIILALMVAVAVFTMVSGLLIIIIERTSMIGTLKAMGARNRTIRHTFLWFAVFIIGKGMLIGNLLGIGVVALQHFTKMVKLDPDTYYVDAVPVELDIPLILLINIGTLVISVLMLIGPSYLISHIQPAKSMKYE